MVAPRTLKRAIFFLVLGLPLASPALAARDAGLDAPLPMAPRVVNPGDSAPVVMREGADLGPAQDAGQPLPAGSALMSSDPRPEPVAQSPSRFNISAGLKASVRGSYQGATPFPLDLDQTPVTVAPFITRVRVTPEIHLNNFGVIAEADTATGAVTGIPPASQVGTRVPYPSLVALELRKLYLEYKWATGAFRVGQQTSNWGLGLLANDGGHDPEAGDFGQQQFGNLTYRALVAVRPFFSLGGQWRAIETAFAADLIVRDNNAEFIEGDRAFQGVVALRYVQDEQNNLGVYVVYRSQRNINSADGGKATDVYVVDLAGKCELVKHHTHSLSLGFEAVTINGTTTQARNENAARLAVHQFGGALKANLRVRRTTMMLDMGFASGDQNPSDDQVQNFRFDRDFKVGLILFDQVMAYQSARSATRAADPSLTGRAPEGVDLLATASSVTGAWYVFPRVKHAIDDWVDVYAGPLFAFSTAALTDPFNTRILGGTSVNPFGVKAGAYLGTEFDVGTQMRFKPADELTITLTGEGGMFLPGSAYRLPQGGLMPPIGFGRVRVSLAL